MNVARYRGVRAVLIESNPVLRGNLRAAFAESGMRDVVIAKDIQSLLDAVEQEIIDLILCDATSLGPDFPAAAQQIRHNGVGRNPFAVIVATANDANESEVHDTLNGGVDDLLQKPMPINLLLDRIGNLIHARKPFVATSGYVGPTRRKNIRRGENDGDLVRVPNTMYSRVVERARPSDLRRLIDDAVVRVEEKKAKNSTPAIDGILRHSIAYYDTFGDQQQLRRDFDHILDMGRDLDVMRDRQGTAEIAELVRSLVHLVARIARSPSRPRPADLELLSNLGDMIRTALPVSELSGKPARRRFEASPIEAAAERAN